MKKSINKKANQPLKKALVIVESPHKAHTIQGYLGDDYLVMACKGHIADLAKGGNFGIGVDVANNFKPHYMLLEDKISVVDALIKAAPLCEMIILSTDDDRDGHAISWHLSQRLADTERPIKRMVFGEIKKSVVQKALNNLTDINMKIVHAQEARRILDRIVGFTASPFIQNFYGNGLSAGRVQSVLTRMIIDKERSIETFVPEDFWTLQAFLSNDGKTGFATKYAGRPTDQSTADAINTKLKDKSAHFIVSEVLSNEEAKYPQPPLITSTLQRLMSKSYGLSADQTMKAAQALYESGYCTYIRTDSVRSGEEAIEEARSWLTSNSHPIPKKVQTYSNKDAAQDAHECIRPSDLTLLPHNNYAIIDPNEKLVYEAIWKYFLASQMNPSIYDTLRITAKLSTDPSIEVKASGKALKSKGYLDILGINDNSTIDIPMLKKGDILKHFGKSPIKMEHKQTQPPARFSEDKLIKELVDKGIGRPATYADLLSKLTTRNYVEKKGSVYHATDLGKKITDELMQFFTFMDYSYTADLEKQLDLIESGKLDHIEMLSKFYVPFKKELVKAYQQHGSSLCSKCSSPMITRTSKAGNKFQACTGYPKCKNTTNIVSPVIAAA